MHEARPAHDEGIVTVEHEGTTFSRPLQDFQYHSHCFIPRITDDPHRRSTLRGSLHRSMDSMTARLLGTVNFSSSCIYYVFRQVSVIAKFEKSRHSERWLHPSYHQSLKAHFIAWP
jgi:hypothetical protein